MKGHFDVGRYSVPVDEEQVRSDWMEEDFSFGIFRDPAGREWNDFVHYNDEYVVVAKGEQEILVGAAFRRTDPGDRVRIPKGLSHSLKTVSHDGSVWFYGYGRWKDR